MSKLVRQVVLHGVGLLVLAVGVTLFVQAEELPTVWAHRPYVVRMAVTNRTMSARTVTKVTTSCACLKAKNMVRTGETPVPPGGMLPFELTLDPTGMEGLVTKRAAVTFDDGTVETMTVRANVRTRLALSPSDAAFGVMTGKGPEITSRLIGCAVTNGGARIVSLVPPANPTFTVRVADDGLGVMVGSVRRADRPPAGSFVETWYMMTTDAEIPKIPLVVSAHFVNGFSASPSVLTVGGDGRRGYPPAKQPEGADRRGAPTLPGVVSRIVSLRCDDRRAFKVLSAETMPRKWGDVRIESRPLNGWRICIENISPNEVRQFSKKPFLEVKTDMPGMERFEIPLRVTNDGGKK